MLRGYTHTHSTICSLCLLLLCVHIVVLPLVELVAHQSRVDKHANAVMTSLKELKSLAEKLQTTLQEKVYPSTLAHSVSF